jgi:Domain of unknown function (DUF4266)
MKTIGLMLLLTAAAALLCGCSSLGVKPWQRGILAKPEMALSCDPLTMAFDDHIYFSKEDISGGRGFAGGGCGCN